MKFELDIKNQGTVHLIQVYWNKNKKYYVHVKALFIKNEGNPPFIFAQTYKFDESSRSFIDAKLQA